MNLKEEKKALRKELKKIRRDLGKEKRLQASQEIVDRLMTLPAYQEAKTLFVFSPMSTEIRLDLLFSSAEAAGKVLLFPATFEEGRMEAYLPRNRRQMTKDPLGFLTPDPEKDQLYDPRDIDLVLVPMLGFDKDLYRIGYGGGFYDRYLNRLEAHTEIIGLAFADQQVDKIPRGFFDFPLPCIVTEEKVWQS